MTLNENPTGVVPMAGAAEVIEFQTATLPVLIERASRTLMEAKSSGEVLEARDMARAAYDAAKSAGRIAKARKAHDEIIAAIHRAQGEASLVRARAEMRLADELDSAQARGELATAGGDRSKIPDENFAASLAEVGIDPKQAHEARKLRDAEKASPGKTKAVIEDIVARGEEPTRAKVHREVVAKPAKEPKAPIDPERRKLAKLTTDALIDEVIGLRADLADAKATIKKRDAEIRDLKEQVKGFEGDQAETIRRQANIIRHKESEMYLANVKADKAIAHAHVLEKEVKRLKKLGIAV